MVDDTTKTNTSTNSTLSKKGEVYLISDTHFFSF
jgi:hypothetical protein